MRELVNEYGRTILAAVAFLLIVALAVSTPILGMNGLLTATENSSPVTGSATTGLKETDDVKTSNRYVSNDSLTQPNQESYVVKRGVNTPLKSLFLTYDEWKSGTKNNNIVYSLISVVDENKKNCLKLGKVSYNRRNHSINFSRSGFYTVTVSASVKGRTPQKCTVGIYVGK